MGWKDENPEHRRGTLNRTRTLYLDAKMDEALEAEAARRGVPVTVLVREYVTEGLAKGGAT